jgi:1,4-dihydroxy-6-naphthoate synthase
VKRHITVACSPDADDRFMMRAILLGLIDLRGYTFDIKMVETDGLNRLADADGPDVSAISVAWYPRIKATYQLLPHGGSAGEGYGPVVISREPMTVADLRGKRVAVPGLTTTAYAILRDITAVEPIVTPITPYELIFDALRSGEVDAGLVIHEGRLTWREQGFHLVCDLGIAWSERYGLPLPLGANAIRRDLGADTLREVSAVLRDSIRHGLDHRDEAIDWLMRTGSVLQTREAVGQYLSMYANERTLDWGVDGRRAIDLLLEKLGDGPADFSD